MEKAKKYRKHHLQLKSSCCCIALPRADHKEKTAKEVLF